MATEEEQMEVSTTHLEELKYLLTLAKHPLTIKLLEKGIKEASSAPQQNGTSQTTVFKPISTKTERSTTVKSKITNYGWDQSDKFVKIYISDIAGLDKVKADDVKSEFDKKSFNVEICNVNGKNYSLVINDLLHPITPGSCTIKTKSGMVIVSLRKESLEKWEFLTGREKKIKDSREVKPSKPEKDEDPSAGLMKMMKKLYDEGDDEMKRTMKKAWHESQDKRMKGEDLM